MIIDDSQDEKGLGCFFCPFCGTCITVQLK